eukprot:snap_masked-scaffold_15-processed-gene-6.0-mRNA-1 protein AED:0.08 eAED:0.16 QI:0/-1/0/1/-1/1/1/0/197
MDLETVNLKLCIIGDGGTGKTSLLMVYSYKEFPHKYTPTVVDTYEVQMSLSDGRKMKLSVYDTAGQEDFKGIRALAYSQVDVVMVCYDCSNSTSFNNVKTLWVQESRNHNKEAPLVLVGTKKDLVESDPNNPYYVKPADAALLAKELDLKGSAQCSALKMERGNVKQVFQMAIKAGLVAKGYVQQPTIFSNMCPCLF